MEVAHLMEVAHQVSKSCAGAHNIGLFDADGENLASYLKIADQSRSAINVG